jgi:hypothetical protein
MDNFLKQFRDNLDNRPEPAFEERDWQALSQRLQPQREKLPLPTWLLWLLAPLFLLSLTANGFQYREMHNTQQKMAVLASRFDTVFNKTQVVIQSDTVYKIHTVFERDTVYKTKIIREKEIVYLPYLKDTFKMLSNKIFNPIENISVAQLGKNDETRPETTTTSKLGFALPTKEESEYKTEISTSLNPDSSFVGMTKPLANTSKETIDKVTNYADKKLIFNGLERLKTMPLKKIALVETPKIQDLKITPIVFTTKKTLGERLEILRPKDYSLGISAGLAYPISDISSKPSGYSVGLQGEMSFSPHISAWADIQYMQLTYNTDRMNEARGIPVVAPPSNDFKFNLVQINQPQVQYMAGLRYHFNGKKGGQPYLGIGYGGVISLPYEVSYEFKNSNLGTVWEASQMLKKRSTDWGFMVLDAGIEKRLSKQYRWQIGANYRLKLSNSTQLYRLLGVKTGFLFDF